MFILNSPNNQIVLIAGIAVLNVKSALVIFRIAPKSCINFFLLPATDFQISLSVVLNIQDAHFISIVDAFPLPVPPLRPFVLADFVCQVDPSCAHCCAGKCSNDASCHSAALAARLHLFNSFLNIFVLNGINNIYVLASSTGRCQFRIELPQVVLSPFVIAHLNKCDGQIGIFVYLLRCVRQALAEGLMIAGPACRQHQNSARPFVKATLESFFQDHIHRFTHFAVAPGRRCCHQCLQPFCIFQVAINVVVPASFSAPGSWEANHVDAIGIYLTDLRDDSVHSKYSLFPSSWGVCRIRFWRFGALCLICG
mmetsp:Transcript_5112/g.6674  ORF Transcript_5112/g.6674 Transcript_5112/m.6674 type:complete len:310 (-) Transcript_5112:75-1004(-)